MWRTCLNLEVVPSLLRGIAHLGLSCYSCGSQLKCLSRHTEDKIYKWTGKLSENIKTISLHYKQSWMMAGSEIQDLRFVLLEARQLDVPASPSWRPLRGSNSVPLINWKIQINNTSWISPYVKINFKKRHSVSHQGTDSQFIVWCIWSHQVHH